jgi:hypothetical protein
VESVNGVGFIMWKRERQREERSQKKRNEMAAMA